MTISIGSYDDLQPDPQPIDRNPTVNCHQCGTGYAYQDYWEPRYIDGKSWNPAEVFWLCDECIEQAKAAYELHKRKRAHKQLTEFEA